MSFLKRTARVAVASSVHGRVQRRQHQRWSSESHAAQPTESHRDLTDRLATLGELHRTGVLTDQEFDAQKSAILARLSS